MNVIKTLARPIRTRIFSGILVLVPIGVTVWIVLFLFRSAKSFLGPLADKVPLGVGDSARTALSAIAFLLVVYLVGLVTAHIIGRRLVLFGESIILRIPMVKTVYTATKQIINSILLSDRTAFKAVVMIEFPRKGIRSIGFLMGTAQDRKGRPLHRLFVPTAPNPTSGFLLMVPESEVQRTDISVEEAFKMLISGGAIAPEMLDDGPSSPDA